MEGAQGEGGVYIGYVIREAFQARNTSFSNDSMLNLSRCDTEKPIRDHTRSTDAVVHGNDERSVPISGIFRRLRSIL